jgi:hypothetical protein
LDCKLISSWKVWITKEGQEGTIEMKGTANVGIGLLNNMTLEIVVQSDDVLNLKFIVRDMGTERKQECPPGAKIGGSKKRKDPPGTSPPMKRSVAMKQARTKERDREKEIKLKID